MLTAAAAFDPRTSQQQLSPRQRANSASPRVDIRGGSQSRSVEPSPRYGRSTFLGTSGPAASAAGIGGGSVGDGFNSGSAWQKQQQRSRARPMSASAEFGSMPSSVRSSVAAHAKGAAAGGGANGSKPYISAFRGSANTGAAERSPRAVAAYAAAGGRRSSAEILLLQQQQQAGPNLTARYSTFNVTPKANEGYGPFGGSSRREDMLRAVLQEEIQKEADRQTLLAKVRARRVQTPNCPSSKAWMNQGSACMKLTSDTAVHIGCGTIPC